MAYRGGVPLGNFYDLVPQITRITKIVLGKTAGIFPNQADPCKFLVDLTAIPMGLDRDSYGI